MKSPLFITNWITVSYDIVQIDSVNFINGLQILTWTSKININKSMKNISKCMLMRFWSKDDKVMDTNDNERLLLVCCYAL